jgi:large subunit ribosomal protein L13
MMESLIVNKTYVPKGQVEREWFLVDAEGQNLGRLATKIAQVLIGKHRPDYTPGVLMGANVVVINAEKVDVYPTRLDSKIYYHHSGYPGGIKEIT